MKSIKGKIEKLEESWAIIRLEDSQTLNWPKDQLPFNAKETDPVWLKLMTQADEQAERDASAKSMLNEILNVSEDGKN